MSRRLVDTVMLSLLFDVRHNLSTENNTCPERLPFPQTARVTEQHSNRRPSFAQQLVRLLSEVVEWFQRSAIVTCSATNHQSSLA